MTSADRGSAVSPRTCSVFVVFGLGRHTSSVKKSSCCVFGLSSCWCAQTPACVPTDVTLLRHHWVWMLGVMGGAHKSQRLPETSSVSDSHWQKGCHTLTGCIDCSPAVAAMMGWSTRVLFSGACEDAERMPGQLGRDVCGCVCSYLPPTLFFPSLQGKFGSNHTWSLGSSMKKTKRVSVCLAVMLTNCGLHLIQMCFRENMVSLWPVCYTLNVLVMREVFPWEVTSFHTFFPVSPLTFYRAFCKTPSPPYKVQNSHFYQYLEQKHNIRVWATCHISEHVKQACYH